MSQTASPLRSPVAEEALSSPILSSALDFPNLNGSIRFKRGLVNLSSSGGAKSPNPRPDSHNRECTMKTSDLERGDSSQSDHLKEIDAANSETIVSKTLPVNASQSLEVQNPILKSQEQKAKISYSNVVDSNSRLPCFSIDASKLAGGTIFDIPSEVENDATPLWTDLLVGRFPDKAPHPGVIHVIVKQIWKFGNKDVRIQVFRINKSMVKFVINDRKVRDKILNRGMWKIADLPMVISKWSPVIEEVQPVLTHMPIWVVIKDIPHKLYTRQGISFLASATGKPLKLHQDTILCAKFDEAKVQVEVDLNASLPADMLVKHSATGQVYRILYSYPWMSPKCSICAKWGHDKEGCLKKLMDVGENLDIGFEMAKKDATDIEEGEIHSSQDVRSESGNIQNEDKTEMMGTKEASKQTTQGNISGTKNHADKGTISPSKVRSSPVFSITSRRGFSNTLSPPSIRNSPHRLNSSPPQKDRVVTHILRRVSPGKNTLGNEGWISPTHTVRSPVLSPQKALQTESRYEALQNMGFSEEELAISDSDVEVPEPVVSDKDFESGRNLRSKKAKAKAQESPDQKKQGGKKKKGRKGRG